MLQKTKYVFLGIFIAALGLWGLAVTIPNSFSSGEVVSAAKMNQNFQALKDAVDALEAKLAAVQEGRSALPSAEGALGRALIRWNDPDASVDMNWSFNASGGDILVQRLSQGRYALTFEGLATGEEPYGTAFAGSLDPAGGNCTVTVVNNEGATAPDVKFGVRCFDASGALADGSFRVLYVR